MDASKKMQKDLKEDNEEEEFTDENIQVELWSDKTTLEVFHDFNPIPINCLINFPNKNKGISRQNI